MKETMGQILIVLILGFFLAVNSGAVMANVSLDSVSTDPSVIAAGDEVILSVNFHENGSNWYDLSNKGEFTLKSWLEPGDTVTSKYIKILDGNGDKNIGHLFYGRAWTKNFRIKVETDAPVGTYQFKMKFQYLKDGKPYSSPFYEYFTISVSKEGIIMNLANIVTSPLEIRPGDDYISLTTYVENAGRKDAKSVEFTLKMPEGFSTPYSNDNRVWVGYVAAGEQKEVTLSMNVDDNVEPGSYEFSANIKYLDTDDNKYEKSISFPVRVREKPVIKVVNSEGSILAGGKSELRVRIKNIGSERAENVDVRLIKASDQPFDLDARSDFVGLIEPGQEKVAVFPLSARRGAPIKDHSFTIIIRAKGDSNKGDDNIYVFNDAATLRVTGIKPNTLLFIGLGIAAIVVLFIIINSFRKR